MHPFNNKPLQDPILAGRDSELEELKRFLDKAISGEGSMVFISGEAGTGKTRLVKEFLKKAEKTDAIILKGWCLSESAIPYFPFVEAFDSYLSLSENAQAQYNLTLNQNVNLKSWLSAIDHPKLIKNIHDQPQAWKDQAFFGVAKELMLLAEKKVLILFLDDIHWADSASLSLLQYLARKVCFERILILASFRSEQLEINSRNNKRQLSMMLLSMGRDDLFSEIKLADLQKDDVKKIAESMLKGKVDSDLVAMLTVDCHGNPLYVVETIRMLYQQKSLFKKDGRWKFRIDNLEIPRKVRDIIKRRLETLKPLE
ncbi:MAG: AAA family ATPase, partial [Candidatus Bathyarchaeota archaeon]